VAGSWWTAVQGFTHWLSHTRGRSQATRLDSLFFGEGAAMNKLALETAVQMAA
jgi:hypothetical protein